MYHGAKTQAARLRQHTFSRVAQKGEKLTLVRMWLKNMTHGKMWLPHMIGCSQDTIPIVLHKGTCRSHTPYMVRCYMTAVIFLNCAPPPKVEVWPNVTSCSHQSSPITKYPICCSVIKAIIQNISLVLSLLEHLKVQSIYSFILITLKSIIFSYL